jgi:NodT family efflux transporter outer membrane factor (OMF) lipoprotein
MEAISPMQLTKNFIYLIAGSLLMSACATQEPTPTQPELVEQALPETTVVAPEFKTVVPKEPDTPSAESRWTGAISGKVTDGWLSTFNDEKLETLVVEALKNNRSLAAAAANLEAAEGLAKQAGARLAPAVNIGGGGQSTMRKGSTSNLAGVALNVNWELDIWGKLRAAASAAEESYKASEADFKFGRQSLVAQMAKSWFLATETYLQEKLAEEAVAIYRRMLEIVNTRLELGEAQPQDVYLAKADLASAEERQRQAQGAFEQSVRSIEVLLGRYPSAELDVSREFTEILVPVPVGIPSELLERRPDIIAAERRVAAAFQRVKSAKAAKLPTIALTTSGGRSSNELINLIGANKGFFSLGANLLAPIDVGGGLEAQVNIETAQQKAALANYGQTALMAFSEVETGISNETLLNQRQELLAIAVKQNRKALQVAKTQYEFGEVDFLSVLQMQARLLGSRIELIRIKNAKLAQRVDLHLALGGSFEKQA